MSPWMNEILKSPHTTSKKWKKQNNYSRVMVPFSNWKNKLHIERLNFYHLPNIRSSFTLYRRDAINGIFWSLDTKVFKKNTQYSYCMLELQKIELQHNVTCQHCDKHRGWHQGGPKSPQLPLCGSTDHMVLLSTKAFPHHIAIA